MASLSEIAGLVMAGALQTVGVRGATEQPVYSVIEKTERIEVRRYAPALAAETVVSAGAMEARNEGFERLANYIFGGNTARGSIAMTAPVVTTREKGEAIAMTAPVVQAPEGGGAWKVQFIMPSKYTLQTLPAPNDPRVRIVEVPARDYAVITFSGSRGAEAVERHTARLMSEVAASGWRAAGEPVSWFYDPPWTPPFLRRNEVAVPVSR